MRGGGRPRQVPERLARRRFWCALAGRDVEVEFAERGLPGLRHPVAVRACSVFEPQTAIGCPRRCLATEFRHQWESSIPVRR